MIITYGERHVTLSEKARKMTAQQVAEACSALRRSEYAVSEIGNKTYVNVPIATEPSEHE